MKKRIIALLTCLALIISVVCIMPDSDAGVATLNITNQTKELTVGQSFQCKLNGLKANKVKWASSNKKIATVNKNGVVKGISKGKTKITGTYKGIKFIINLTVNKSETSSKSLKIIKKGDYTIEVCSINKSTYANQKCVDMHIKFTNNENEPTCFNYTTMCRAFQDGEELDWDSENITKMVKDGASVECDIYFYYISNSDVEVQILNDDYSVAYIKKVSVK
jgi:hypothetical protein